ncbi:hypothetical protein [Sorlinia euscelidii]
MLEPVPVRVILPRRGGIACPALHCNMGSGHPSSFTTSWLGAFI